MERIVLEVDSAIARAWRNTSPAARSRYEKKIASVLKDLKRAEFSRLLEQASQIAADNGLTEEKLNTLLNEED